MIRRRFVQAATVLLGAALLGVLGTSTRWVQRAVQLLQPRIDRSSPPGRLESRERRALVALAEALVADAALPEADLVQIGEHIDDRALVRPGYLALYRAAAESLDRLGPAPFASLSLVDRIELVTRHELERPALRLRDHARLFGRGLLAIRALVAPDLVSGYYLAPSGWATVGYLVFPGRCGGLERYTSPER